MKNIIGIFRSVNNLTKVRKLCGKFLISNHGLQKFSRLLEEISSSFIFLTQTLNSGFGTNVKNENRIGPNQRHLLHFEKVFLNGQQSFQISTLMYIQIYRRITT